MEYKKDNITYSVDVLGVTENFTNRFAQNVYKLEDGSTIYIDYDNEGVTIERPKFNQ